MQGDPINGDGLENSKLKSTAKPLDPYIPMALARAQTMIVEVSSAGDAFVGKTGSRGGYSTFGTFR